jgi:AcrR family transcriptional regulator
MMSGAENSERGGRYRPLPTGMHGLDPEVVSRDQRDRLRNALVELIAEKGYPGVRIVDLSRLARVSQPTLYSLFADKEELFVSAYEAIAERTYRTVIAAYGRADGAGRRLERGIAAFAELAAAEPEAISLLVLGAFGAGAPALERRNLSLEQFEARVRASRDREPVADPADLTIKFVLGGLREVFAARLSKGEGAELPPLSEQLAAWAGAYPVSPPAGLLAAVRAAHEQAPPSVPGLSERARRAGKRLPSGRSDLPRETVIKSQQERIVDATAAIVAEKGLAGLTIPEIARRASVSNKTFYEIYESKHGAFLGAQKIGMLQALRVAVQAYEERMPNWPRAIAGGLRALIDYLVSEPDHAHLSIVDTFGASPDTIATRAAILASFAGYLQPGYGLAPDTTKVPAIAVEAVVGGAWQVLHHYIASGRLGELPAASRQLTYLILVPFLGPERAAQAAQEGP